MKVAAMGAFGFLLYMMPSWLLFAGMMAVNAFYGYTMSKYNLKHVIKEYF
jgi:hypothetical protein